MFGRNEIIGVKSGKFQHRSVVFITLSIALLTAACYLRTVGYDFINFDDGDYVTENPVVRSGLTLKGIRWAFTTTYFSNWHPVTWLSHMIDVTLFDMNAGLHHLVNIILHALSAGLLFLVLYRMTGTIDRSAFVAVLFGVHPLHVESVAWITERKDVLSGLFFMLVLLSYDNYVRQRSVRRYLLVLACFALGLMAKPMLVTTPFVLMLLDIWPLGRTSYLSPANRSEWAPVSPSRLLAEKAPLLLITSASAVITYIAQQRGGSVVTMEMLPYALRAANSVVSYFSYLGKMVWPSHLAVFYPYPIFGVLLPRFLSAVAIIALISFVSFRWRRRRPYLAVGWLWYLGMLLPVIGFFQAGSQAMADRYTYLPMIGAFIMVSWSGAELHASVNLSGKRLVGSIIFLALIALSATTIVQTGYWRNSEALFTHATLVTADNAVAHNNLGATLADQGKTYDAVQHFRAAIQIQPSHADAHYNLAKFLYLFPDKIDEAIEHLRIAIRIRPHDADFHFCLGLALEKKGWIDEAIAQMRETLVIKPSYEPATKQLDILMLNKIQSANVRGSDSRDRQ